MPSNPGSETGQSDGGTDLPGAGLIQLLDQTTLLRQSARCPKCGEPVSGLSNGAYACDRGGRGERASHIYYSRRQLDGDIKWWHGRLPVFPVMLFVAMYVAVIVAFEHAKEGFRNYVR